VYLVTGKQFRSELHKLFCACCRRCRSSSSSSSPSPPPPPPAAAVNVRMVRRGQADTAVWNFTHCCAEDIRKQTSLQFHWNIHSFIHSIVELFLSVSRLDKPQTEYLLSNITNRTKTVRSNYVTLVFISPVFIKLFVLNIYLQ